MQIRWLGRVGYTDAWAQQRALHERIASGEEPDTVLLLEHDAVYTAGKRTRSDERKRPNNPPNDILPFFLPRR